MKCLNIKTYHSVYVTLYNSGLVFFLTTFGDMCVHIYNCIHTFFTSLVVLLFPTLKLHYLYTDIRDTNLLHLNVATPRQAIMNTNKIKATTIDIIIAARKESA